jgi:site-specific recombinase XerC
MGMTLPPLAVATLDQSAPAEVGRNSAALHVNDAVSQAFTLAVGSVTFGALLTASTAEAFASVMGLSLLLVAAAIVRWHGRGSATRSLSSVESATRSLCSARR